MNVKSVIRQKQNIETQNWHMKQILYVDNYKTKHNSTQRSPADIFLYAGSPDFNVQQKKIDKIENLNKNRHDFEVDIKYRQAPLVKSKITNPFKI